MVDGAFNDLANETGVVGGEARKVQSGRVQRYALLLLAGVDGGGAGAGFADHIHFHLVPRWSGDTNFMTTIAEARVMPQHLLETYDRLRPSFAWLDGGS